jgi:hypothetical protein
VDTYFREREAKEERKKKQHPSSILSHSTAKSVNNGCVKSHRRYFSPMLFFFFSPEHPMRDLTVFLDIFLWLWHVFNSSFFFSLPVAHASISARTIHSSSRLCIFFFCFVNDVVDFVLLTLDRASMSKARTPFSC